MRYWLMLLIVLGVALVMFSFFKFSTKSEYVPESETGAKTPVRVSTPEMIEVRTVDRSQKNALVIKPKKPLFPSKNSSPSGLRVNPPEEGWDHVK